MKQRGSTTTWAVLIWMMSGLALSNQSECAGNCTCAGASPGTQGTSMSCPGFPDRYVPEVTNLTITRLDGVELPVGLLEPGYGRTLQHLNLSGLNIGAIRNQGDQNLLPNLETLSMAGNTLRHLSDGIFSWCLGVVELALNDNGIKNISARAFAALQNLRVLNLANNNLLTLDSVLMPSSLASLDVSNNELEEFPRFTRNLQALDTLKLDGNEYRTVPAGAFGQFPGLSTLSLGDAVTSVEEGSLSAIAGLTSLKLTGKGDLNYIAGKEIRALPQLRVLELAFFTFPVIDKSLLRGFPALRTLRLVDIASMGGFELGALEHLANLTALDLTRSPALAASLFSGRHEGTSVPSLQSLLVSETNVSAPSESWFAVAPNLAHLDISNNPITCDGKWCGVAQAVLIGQLKLLNQVETTCAEPRDLYGKQLVDLTVIGQISQSVTESDNATTASPPPSGSGGGPIHQLLDRWGITTDDLLYTILALAIAVFLLMMAIIIVAYYRSKKCNGYCRGTKEGSAESFMMRADSEYTFDNFTLSETMAESQRAATLSRNGKFSAKS